MPWLDTSFLPQSETPETSKQQHLNLESAGESGSGLGCVCSQSDKAPQAPLVSEGAIWLGSEQGRQPPAVSSVAWSRAGAACVLSLPPRDKMTVSGERGGPTMQTDKIRDTNKHSESRGLGPDPLPRVRTVAPSSNSGSVRFISGHQQLQRRDGRKILTSRKRQQRNWQSKLRQQTHHVLPGKKRA
jgi:hypothetical protein